MRRRRPCNPPLRALAPIMAAGLFAFQGAGCREEPPPTDAGPTQDPVPPEAIDLACALATSCAELGSVTSSVCATDALTRPGSGPRYTEEYIECFEAAGADCEAVRACSPRPSGNPCEDLGEGSFCDGSLLVSCFAGFVEYSTDCTSWDLACFEEADRAMCQGDGPSCLPGTERCEGVDAIICMGYREASFDCGDFVEGRICQMRGERAECVPPESECDAVNTPGTCEGNDLVFCSASGTLTRLDCTALGFETCVVDETSRAVCGDAETTE